MRVSKRAGAVALGAAFALVAAGCSGGGGNTEAPSGNTDGAITIDGSQPENPLVPSDISETGGGKVADSLWTGLVEYNPDTAAPENAVAESIETTDSKVFKIKIKQGWKFHDGTEVKAKNFVDAWNWAAYSPNGAENAYFFDHIEGFADVQSEDPDGDGPKPMPEPKAKTMSGLKVVDDYNFEVTLSAPFAVFPTMLGYTAFSPLPDSFFTAKPEEFGRKPIGNGPFKFVSWENDQQIKITRNDDYAGKKPKVKDVTFKFYADLDTAYADLQSDNLDFLQVIPTSALTGDKYRTDLPDRYIDKAVGVIQTMTVPLYVKRFDNPKFIQAVSMAIDRDTITDKIFNKTRQPATGWVSPAVDGYKEGVCGDLCKFDAAKAKQLFTESGFTGEFTIGYNANGGHKEWVEATCNSINTAFGAQVCKPKAYADFALFRQDSNAFKHDGLFRTGWQMDYPSIENFLNPLYKTNASSNDGKYSSAEFDAKVAAADKATDPKEAIKLYQEAEAVLAKDFPVIPLWYVKQQSGFSNNVTNVKVTPFGEIDLESVQVK